MDDGSFEAWLGSIRLLSARQRQVGFMSLALADDDRDVAFSDAGRGAPLSGEETGGAVDAQPVGFRALAKTDTPLLAASAAAQRRIENAGCPHCASRHLQHWGRASGLPRYRCRECRRTFNGLTGTPVIGAKLVVFSSASDQVRPAELDIGCNRPAAVCLDGPVC
jgi:ribosomal protein L37AE/L43A